MNNNPGNRVDPSNLDPPDLTSTLTLLSTQLSALTLATEELRNEAAQDRAARLMVEKRLTDLEKGPPSCEISENGDSIGDTPSVSRTASIVQNGVTSENLNSGTFGVDAASFVSSANGFGMRKLFDLPMFSGRPEEWPRFVAAFNMSTEAYKYTTLENTFRLQKCLTGEALEEVESLLIYPENVKDVIVALKDRFGRPELIVRSQLRKAKSLPPVPENKMELLIPFALRVQNLVAFLDTPATRDHLVNPSLLEELVFKLPVSKREEWALHSISIPHPTLGDFGKWVKRAAAILSRVTMQTSPSRNQPSTSGFGTRTRAAPPTAPTVRKNFMFLANNEQSSNSIRLCVCCADASHKLVDCKQFNRLPLSSRWDLAKSKKICFICLQRGHSVSSCWRRKRCGIDNCSMFHHALLHDSEEPSRSKPDSVERNVNTEPSEERDPNQRRMFTCRSTPAEPRLLFRVLPVKLHGPKAVISTYALLDEGSSVTLIDEDLATELELTGPSRTLNLQWFGERSTSEPSRSVSVHISGASSSQYELTNVKTVRNLNLPCQTIGLNELHTRYLPLKGLPIDDFKNVSPRLLIGLDHCHLGVASRKVECASGPVAAQTKLGWVVYGPYAIDGECSSAVVLHCKERENVMDDIQKQVSDYFTIENFGVLRQDNVLESEADIRARQLLASTTARVGDGSRFETGLLWATDDVRLPDSRAMALGRLKGVEKKMRENEKYAAEYRNIMRGYIEKGYARKLNEDEANCTSRRVWYLPHFAVSNPNKPKKLRMVFDAAAKVNGVSLNTHLLTGPDLNQPLIVVLHQFRMGTIGICGDIREMFLRIQIREEDQQCQRFLWRDGNEKNPVDTYIMSSMTFGAACSPCSAQYVKNVNAVDMCDGDNDAMLAIHKHHYVDDFVASFDNPSDAIRVTRGVIEIHQKGGFELRNIISNAEAVQRTFGAECQEGNAVVGMDPASTSEKILGMWWNTCNDNFQFKLRFARVDPDVISRQRRPTKREALSIAMSVFDPFGLLANYTVYAKVLLQDLWRIGIEWDQPIPDEHFERWSMWMDGLESCSLVAVPRCYSKYMRTSPEIQLHIFADASEVAFAAVAYWRIKTPEPGKRYELAFVSGKSRCAPQKLLSIPRLELQAAVMATRMYSAIVAAHDVAIDKVVFWTDSKTVFQWIRSDHRRFKPFVAHRVAEILEVSTPNEWHWLPTDLNVADDATRTKYPPEFDANGRWITGPTFLLQEQLNIEDPVDLEMETEEELRPKFLNLISNRKQDLDIYFMRFSNYSRLKRAMGWAIRYKNILFARIKSEPSPQGELTASELDLAERELCRFAQSEDFALELEFLRNGKDVPKSSAIHQLSPCLDSDGVIRMSGRIDAAKCMPSTARRPIILPKLHALTKLIVSFYHLQSKHQNENAIICNIRQRFWVPHIRALVQQSKRGCMICRIRSAKPAVPMMGQLPEDRLTPNVRPFTYTGLDYFGPLLVTIGRRKEKRWVALFTCLTIRAIHLELATDLSTDACIVCLRNFVNVRGVPLRIRSDNGTNFVGANKEIKNCVEMFDQEAIKQELGKYGIEWRFNSPSHPEAGGCWERMVQSVKKILSVTLKEVAPQVETLRSLLIEAANIINSRPLTHVPVDSRDEEPLTPNHFLLGSANSTQTPADFDQRSMCLRKQWRVAQQLKNAFWKRWMDEALPELTKRTKWHKDCEPLKKGDLVLVCESTLPRGQWRRGRILEVFPGPDGRVRNATVQTQDGVLRRPASRLAKLIVCESSG